LISTDVLANHMNDPAFAIIDCRFKLEDISGGEREYAARHILERMAARSRFGRCEIASSGIGFELRLTKER
jgi:hypothetical protein